MAAHDVNPMLHHLDRVVYIAGGGAVAGTAAVPADVSSPVFSGLRLPLRRPVQGSARGTQTPLFGGLLGVTTGQVTVLAVVGAIVLAVLALIGRPLLFASVGRIEPGAGGAARTGVLLARADRRPLPALPAPPARQSLRPDQFGCSDGGRHPGRVRLRQEAERLPWPAVAGYSPGRDDRGDQGEPSCWRSWP